MPAGFPLFGRSIASARQPYAPGISYHPTTTMEKRDSFKHGSDASLFGGMCLLANFASHACASDASSSTWPHALAPLFLPILRAFPPNKASLMGPQGEGQLKVARPTRALCLLLR